MTKIVTYFLLILSYVASARSFDCLDFQSAPILTETYSHSPIEDFPVRDRLPQTEIPKEDWNSIRFGKFGPCPITFPGVNSDHRVSLSWRQKRLLAVAKKYIGLPYGHYHFPDMGGLDCSNFSAWIYNYGFGVRFTSNVSKQSETAGRLLFPSEALAPGDLLYFFDNEHRQVIHVAIYIDEDHVIDAAEDSIQVRPRSGRYLRNFARARRILE